MQPSGVLCGFTTSLGEATADLVEMAREPELEVGPEDRTEWLRSPDKTLTGEELLRMDERRQWILEMESPPGEDAVKTVEMTTKDLGCHIHLAEEAAAGCQRADSNYPRSSIVGEMLKDKTNSII